jgi:hypothetical protein
VRAYASGPHTRRGQWTWTITHRIQDRDLEGRGYRAESSGGRWCPTTIPKEKAKDRKRVVIPTPEEWAEQQLENAPPRSEEWARRVARIYCLDIGGDDDEREAV